MRPKDRSSRLRDFRAEDRGSIGQASLTITGININVAAGLVAAIGDVRQFSSPQKLVSYVGPNPRVRQSGLGLAQHGRISKRGRSHARAMLVEAAWAVAKAPGPLRSFFLVSGPDGDRSQRSPWHASSPCSAGICSARRPTTNGRVRRWLPARSARCSCRLASRREKAISWRGLCLRQGTTRSGDRCRASR